MPKENSREWLLENSALPVIEALSDKMVGFQVDLNGDFFLTNSGYISDGSICRGGPGSHGATCKEAVDNWFAAVLSMEEDEHWASDNYGNAKRFKPMTVQVGPESVVVFAPFKPPHD